MVFQDVKLEGADQKLKENVVENLNLNTNLKEDLINGLIVPRDALHIEIERINTELEEMPEKVAKNVTDKIENKKKRKELLKKIVNLKNDINNAIGEEKKEIREKMRKTHYYYNLYLNNYKRLLQEEEKNDKFMKILQEKKKILEKIEVNYDQEKFFEVNGDGVQNDSASYTVNHPANEDYQNSIPQAIVPGNENVQMLDWGFDEETSTEPTNQHMIFFRQIKRNDDM